MNTDPIILYAVLLTGSALILLIIGLVISYLSLLGKFLKLKDRKEKEAKEELENIYKDTQVKMDKLASETYVKSKQIIDSASIYSEKQTKLIEEDFKKTSNMYLSLYQKSLTELENHTLKVISEVPSQIGSVFSSNLGSITDNFSKDLDNVKIEFKKAIESTYNSVDLQLEEYKKERYKQVDANIIEIIQQIAKKVLVKQISYEEHEKIVTKALEDAKKAGIFSSSDKV